jgi:NADPH-dependent curcumin reductase CurA
MAPVHNAALIYQRIPEKSIVPGETTKYISSRQIDLNNVAIAGGFLAKILVLSSDPYLRGRMRDPNVKSYSPPFLAGEPYACLYALFSDITHGFTC